MSVEFVTGFTAAASQATGVYPRWAGGDRRPPPSLEMPTPLASPQSKRKQLVVQKKNTKHPTNFSIAPMGEGVTTVPAAPGPGY